MPALNFLRRAARRAAYNLVPGALAALAVRPGGTRRTRLASLAGLLAAWSAFYARYRSRGVRRTAEEYELLRTANWETFTKHYSESVPTIEEEFVLWGPYHQHRHEMRYDLVAGAVREHLPAGGSVLDIGCGAALVADRLRDVDGFYVGMDFSEHHVAFPAKKYRDLGDLALGHAFARGIGEHLPFADASFDVVVMSEVIEHLMAPELTVWELARVLRPGGVFVMTTNNASEVPCRSPLTHLFAWGEKALGAYRPGLISYRPWIWPEPVDPAILPPDAPPVYVPHSHHIYAQTSAMFAAAGLDTFSFRTFEFPPPQSTTSAVLNRLGTPGQRTVDLIEAVAQRIPVVNKLGCHLFLLARRTDAPVAAEPPPGVWPGPFS